MAKSPLEKVGAGPQKMTREDILDESESAASWSPNEDWRTIMSKLVKVITPFCYIYDADFITLPEEQENGVGKDLNGISGLVLDDPT